jgi:hypothetical protein
MKLMPYKPPKKRCRISIVNWKKNCNVHEEAVTRTLARANQMKVSEDLMAGRTRKMSRQKVSCQKAESLLSNKVIKLAPVNPSQELSLQRTDDNLVQVSLAKLKAMAINPLLVNLGRTINREKISNRMKVSNRAKVEEANRSSLTEIEMESKNRSPANGNQQMRGKAFSIEWVGMTEAASSIKRAGAATSICVSPFQVRTFAIGQIDYATLRK